MGVLIVLTGGCKKFTVPSLLPNNVKWSGLVIGFTSFLNADLLSPDPGIFLYPDPRFPESEPEIGLKNAIYFFVNS